MNKFLWSCAGLVTLFVTAEALLCYTCDLGIFGTCFKEKVVNCSADQTNCYVGTAEFNTWELTKLYASGCISDSDCKNESGTILTATYNVTRHCCSTDKCNGATSLQLSLTVALGTALLAICST